MATQRRASQDRGFGLDSYAGRLDAALKHGGKTGAQLAAAVGCTRQAVVNVLYGHSGALNSVYHVEACRILGVSSYWLATGRGHMTAAEANEAQHWPFAAVSYTDVMNLSGPERTELEQVLMNKLLELWKRRDPAQTPASPLTHTVMPGLSESDLQAAASGQRFLSQPSPPAGEDTLDAARRAFRETMAKELPTEREKMLTEAFLAFMARMS